MSTQPDFVEAWNRARQMHAQGRLEEAERAYGKLSVPAEHREQVLRELVELHWQARSPGRAIAALEALTREVPDELFYYARLATLLDSLGQTNVAIRHYERLLERQPDMAAAHFNVALLYKKNRRFDDALKSYDTAIRKGIADVHEVFSNMGVLYSEIRNAISAAEMFEHALTAEPQYIPALFNRAGLHEEAGEKEDALDLYERILSIEPEHADALARLAHASRIKSDADPIVASLKRAIENGSDEDLLAREGLLFALGKVQDDLGQYREAFATYRAANELGMKRHPPYDPRAIEADFQRIIDDFGASWIRSVETDSMAAPIFICGMFRSGSTLLEQILSVHPDITAGGELDTLPWLMTQHLSPYPDAVKNASSETLVRVGSAYLAEVERFFPGAAHVTDKRPDNFLRLGLIRALFPSARIIHTRRSPLDNCLSVYFQQLGSNLNYATDLEATAHYYQQHEQLLAHWTSCFPDNLVTIDYDELVRTPEPVLRGLLDFLGLPWDERVLAFEKSESLAKTASVWQVREELHEKSSGRWRNYEMFLSGIRAQFAGDEDPADRST